MVDQNCAAGVIEVSGQALEARCLEGVAFQAAVVTDVGVPYGLPTEIALQDRRAKAKLFERSPRVARRLSTPMTRMPRSWAPSTLTPAA